MADWETSTPGTLGIGSALRALTRLRVDSTRDSRIRRLAASVQRCATGSPEQVHDRVGSAQRVGGRRGSQGIRPGMDLDVAPERLTAALGVTRERHDASRRERGALDDSATPIVPVAPVITTRI